MLPEQEAKKSTRSPSWKVAVILLVMAVMGVIALSVRSNMENESGNIVGDAAAQMDGTLSGELNGDGAETNSEMLPCPSGMMRMGGKCTTKAAGKEVKADKLIAAAKAIGAKAKGAAKAVKGAASKALKAGPIKKARTVGSIVTNGRRVNNLLNSGNNNGGNGGGNPQVNPTSPGVPLQVTVHLAGRGDQTYGNNQWAGTMGQRRRMEGVAVSIRPPIANLGIEYFVHISGRGDSGWCRNGEYCGTRGQKRQIEGIGMRLFGGEARNYNVFYGVHLAKIGTTNWCKNGQFCGTRGQRKRMEALIVIVEHV